MKIIYLCSYKAILNIENVYYNDIKSFNKKNEIIGDCMTVPLESYDILIASPPCNYWSRANYRRNISEYSQKTKHLLPDLLKKFSETNKPFIIENVRNKNLFEKELPIIWGLNIYEYGRHTYFTNIYLDFDFWNKIPKEEPCNIQHTNKKDREGKGQVNKIFEEFIKKLSN